MHSSSRFVEVPNATESRYISSEAKGKSDNAAITFPSDGIAKVI